MESKILLFVGLLYFGAAVPALCGEHSLYYIYTALSKPIQLPGIYEFIALGMLDDRELDYYSSQTQIKVPMQTWMQEKMDKDYWEKGTQSRKSKEQWFKVNLDILMDRMNHNKSDLHVLQWRHGCVINENTDRSVSFVSGIDEYSYDGSEFLSFDGQNSRWIAPVPAAEATKRKWDDVPILNQYTKGYLEKECVDWLSKFMGYGEASLKTHIPPDVFIFAKKSVTNSNKLTLTCMATGFYPPDVQMYIRKSRTTLPEHLTTSSGIRPNDDGTYQLRKCVDVLEEDKARYDCYVTHSTLNEPIITKWSTDGKCFDCDVVLPAIVGGVIGLVATLFLVGLVLFILKKRGIITSSCGSNGDRNANGYNPTDTGPVTAVNVNEDHAQVPAESVAVNVNGNGVYTQVPAVPDMDNGPKSSKESLESGSDSGVGNGSAGRNGSFGSASNNSGQNQETSEEDTPMLPEQP
ncbi:zinc-alpha-2-glycoprotein-like [Trichomycterus rosablanca]|uniref:zinc-alpha-2-glycoprotein-like n=1 Tax=Trichomycterus rosablanca TaxID=2290929 RepID=UPI002F355C1E